MSDSRQGVPPYFERLLQRFAAADADAQAAFGRHVHWGYWNDPSCVTLSVEEYGRAAEALCQELLRFASITNDQRILDVGCGVGGTIACLNEQYEGLRLLGVNIDLQQLLRAAGQVSTKAGNSVHWFVSDAAMLPFVNESIDTALAVESVFHFDRPRFFAEIGRVLSPGGTLTLSDFVPDSRVMPYIGTMGLGGDASVRETYGEIDITWSIDRYQRLAVDHGLTLADTRDVTTHTLPTYDFLRQMTGDWHAANEGSDFERATSLLQKASRRGYIKYQFLRFAKH